jgi:hypothetical protein
LCAGAIIAIAGGTCPSKFQLHHNCHSREEMS